MFKFKIIAIFICIITFSTFSNAKIQIKYKIGDEIITNFDISEEKKYLLFLRPNLKNLNTVEITKISEDSLIKDIIKKKEIKKVFTKPAGKNFEEKILNDLYRFKKVKNKDQFINLLNQNKIEYDKIIDKVKHEALWNDLIYRKFNSLVKIDKNHLQNVLRNKLKNNTRYEYNLSELLFEVNNNEELNSKYVKILKYIDKTDFKTAAVKFSVSNSNNRGGEIGWIKETLLSVNLSKILNEMNVREITEPIEYPNGYLLLKINNKREMKEIIDFNKELDELIRFERNRQLNQFSLLFYKKLKQNTIINEN